MREFEVTLNAVSRKTFKLRADSKEEAIMLAEAILENTDLLSFSDEDVSSMDMTCDEQCGGVCEICSRACENCGDCTELEPECGCPDRDCKCHCPAWWTLRTIESVFGRFQSMFDHPGRTELRYTSKHRLLGTKGSLSGAIP